MTTTQPTAAVRVDVTHRESASRRGRPHPASAESAPRTRRPTNRVSETYPGCCSRCTLASTGPSGQQTAPMRDLRGAQQVPGPSPQERSRSPEVSGNQGQKRLQQRECQQHREFGHDSLAGAADQGGAQPVAARQQLAVGAPAALLQPPAVTYDPRRGPRRPSHRAGWRAARDPDPRRSSSWRRRSHRAVRRSPSGSACRRWGRRAPRRGRRADPGRTHPARRPVSQLPSCPPTGRPPGGGRGCPSPPAWGPPPRRRDAPPRPRGVPRRPGRVPRRHGRSAGM